MAAGFTRREHEGNSLQATALVHEVYLRRIMRRILVDAARKRSTSKHGGGLRRIDIDEVLSLSHQKDSRLIALDDALNELRGADSRKAQLVELRYFGGLSVEETAAVLKVSVETVTRDWRLARGWLLSEIEKTDTPTASEMLGVLQLTPEIMEPSAAPDA